MTRYQRLQAWSTLHAIVFAALCGACNSTAAQSDPASHGAPAAVRIGAVVSPIVALDRSKVLAGSEQELYLLLRFEVPIPPREQSDRPPLNLALVIDRSGSMADKGKITYAREASKRLIDAMAPTDVLGVVEYDNRISVLWPSSPLTSPSVVKDLIDGLTPRNSTNLAGGLTRGLDEARRYAREGTINRVLLLSDGLANTGITDPGQIARFVREARRQGLTVSTLGLGLDYNEDLMQAVAEVGGGNYYYVESPAQMAEIFQQELSTLFTTVARNVILRFEAGEGTDGIDVLGYETTRQGGGTDVALENLYGGETRAVVARLRLAPRRPGKFELGSLRLSYTDCQSNLPVVADFDLVAEATLDAAAVTASMDLPVSAEAALLTADEEHQRYLKQYERGEKDLAKGNIMSLARKVAGANALLKDSRLDKKLEQLRMESADMDQADLTAENRQAYLKGSKERFYQGMRGKRDKYMMQENDHGREVEALQNKLKNLNLYGGPVDGAYNQQVARAIRDYQQQKGLVADGIAGPATLRSLGLY